MSTASACSLLSFAQTLRQCGTVSTISTVIPIPIPVFIAMTSFSGIYDPQSTVGPFTVIDHGLNTLKLAICYLLSALGQQLTPDANADDTAMAV